MSSELEIITVNPKERIIYAGFPGPEEAWQAGMSMHWKEYPATEEGLKQLVKDGYQAVSVFEFSAPIVNGGATVIRYGDMILDFDAKKNVYDADGNITGKIGNIAEALLAVREFVTLLEKHYSVNPQCLRFYASGGKGFHLVIPRGLIGSGDGDPQLPQIYLDMLSEICSLSREKVHELKDGLVTKALGDCRRKSPEDYCIDRNGFKNGKGQLIRLPHIKRPNGTYKIPVSYAEICNEDHSYFEELVRSDRRLELETEPMAHEEAPKLAEVYLRCKARLDRTYGGAENNRHLAIHSMESGCEFFRFCKEHPAEVTEPQWFLLAGLLAKYNKEGRRTFHEISSLDPARYDAHEADKKFSHAWDKTFLGHPPTCKAINGHFRCSKQCAVKSPADIYKKQLSREALIENFGYVDDKLVYYNDPEDRDNYEILSSRIEVKAFVRDEQSNNWSKLVEVTDPDGQIHLCRIPAQDINGTGEKALETVCKAGLQLSTVTRSRKLVISYLQVVQPKLRGRMYPRHGWTSESFSKYLPFDLGFQANGSEYLCMVEESTNPIYRAKGSLGEWQQRIGILCNENWLMIVAAIAGLAGACLNLARMKGFGVHFFGPSSKGKTTLLQIACSVTGTELGSWRATDNGLEAVCASYNDGTLVLDEIGQCNPDALYEIVYMLFNGMGKKRSSKSGSPRAQLAWNLLSISSGEETIVDRISKSFRNKAMAGHEVRMVSILADIKDGYGVFNHIPENLKDGQDLANKIKKEVKEVYGAPLRAMIGVIQFCPDSVRRSIERYADMFMAQYEDDRKLSSQAARVAYNFAFLAGVGEVAIINRIFPWKSGSAMQALRYTFERWLDQNNGDMDFELGNSIEVFLNDARSKFPSS